jgi:enamine deaminase RidA (YjgF/YER057c/UK114 family)
MTVELRNVPGQSEPAGFSHISIAPPGRIVHLAGQPGVNPDGTFPEGLAAQTERAALNFVDALEAAGATPDDLVKLTILVVGWNESMTGELFEGVIAAAAVKPLPPVPTTMHGVQALFEDAMLVEIEGVAVLP